MENEKNKVNDLSKILNEYENKWVVLSNDNTKVLAAGNSPDEIEDYIPLGIIMKVPRFDVLYSPSNTHQCK